LRKAYQSPIQISDRFGFGTQKQGRSHRFNGVGGLPKRILYVTGTIFILFS
jgi:hypothetical protein